MSGSHQEQFDSSEEILTDEPSMYKVVLLNDDYTTMEFVVEILTGIFHRTAEEAEKIMLSVHRKGSGVCGIYPFEIAETKTAKVAAAAKKAGFPLRCVMERE